MCYGRLRREASSGTGGLSPLLIATASIDRPYSFSVPFPYTLMWPPMWKDRRTSSWYIRRKPGSPNATAR
ncbi:MAG: hypothetical protein K0S45_3515 [Nitrospira sp.]|jgi:hypothetical protein|nr:hypothetical protein [Nitrospira sp.]